MRRWEYTHIRAKVGIRVQNPHSFGDDKEVARFFINGVETTIYVDKPSVSTQDALVACLNELGGQGWEVVSHQVRVVQTGMVSEATEYNLILKREIEPQS